MSNNTSCRLNGHTLYMPFMLKLVSYINSQISQFWYLLYSIFAVLLKFTDGVPKLTTLSVSVTNQF